MIQFSLDNNHACSIKGTIHFAFPDAQKLVLHDVRYEPGIDCERCKKRHVLFTWKSLSWQVFAIAEMILT